MTRYARDRAADTEAEAATRAAGRAAAVPPILGLQRQAGNAAVASLLATPALTVQRGKKRKAPATPASSSKKPRVAPPSAPTLSAKVTQWKPEDCGSFALVRKWSVSPGTAGVIVQEVTRVFDIERHEAGKGWSKITGADIDTYVQTAGVENLAYATELRYWEAWEVPADGKVEHGDQFMLCPVTDDLDRRHETSRGSYVITGEARFYPGVTSADLTARGFSMTGAEMAHGLLATLTAPTLPAPAGNAVAVTATVTWDSTRSERGARSRLTVT